MGSRYSQARQIKDQNGVRRSQTWIINPPASNSLDTYIVTTTPDRLDQLAYDFYNNEQLWWVIAAANGLGKGTFLVPSNTKLRIPYISDIDELQKQINQNR